MTIPIEVEARSDVATFVKRPIMAEWIEKQSKSAMYCRAGMTLHEFNSASTLAGCEIDIDNLFEHYLESTDPFEGLLGETAAAIITSGHGRGEPLDVGRIWQLSFQNRVIAEPWAFAFTTESKDAVRPLSRSLLESTILMQRRQVTMPAMASAATLFSLSGLPRNWDGYSGQAIEQAVVDRAFQVLSHLAAGAALNDISLPPPSVGPSADGSIHFEWDAAEGYLDVECPADPTPLSFYMELRDGSEEAGQASSFEALWEAVAKLFS